MISYSRFGLLAGIVGGLAIAAPQPSASSALAPAAKTAAPVSTTNTPSSAASTSASPTTTGTISLPSESKVFGVFEIRPSRGNGSGVTETEDTIELGYQFNAKTKLSYAQFLVTDLFPASGTGQGVNLRGDGGFLRLRVNDIWVSASKKTTLSYQPRIYTPTDNSLSGRGFVATIYNALRLQTDVGSGVKLGIAEVPMFQIYSQNGFVNSKGANQANPIYQNRVELTLDVALLKNLSFSLPIILDAMRNHEFAGSTFGSSWQAKFWAWPEINYEINGTHTVGVGFRTDNLVAPNLTALTVGNAFSEGTLQAIWTVSL